MRKKMRDFKVGDKFTVRDSETLNKYLNDVNNIDLLTSEEEYDCAVKAAIGDQKAIHLLVTSNLRFVISVAKQYASKDNPLSDLINEGNLGLLESAQTFDPERGFKFISYAVWNIRKYIYQFITNNGRTVRLPGSKISTMRKLEKRTNELEQRLSRSVDIHEVIEENIEEFSEQDIQQLSLMSKYDIDSLDREVGYSDDSSATLMDFISNDSMYEASDYLVEKKSTKTVIEEAISTLKPREQRMMTAIYGLDGNNPITIHELSNELGLTAENIRQIKKKTLGLLKFKLKKVFE